jgi:hypothetical protein
MTARIPAALFALAFVAGGAADAQTPPPPAAAPQSKAAPAAPAERKPEPTPAPPSAEAVREGKALLAKFVESLGGAEKVRKIHDVSTRGLVTAKTSQGDMSMDVQTTMVFPDRISQQVDAPFGRMVMVATASNAFLIGPNAVQDLPPAMRDELLRQVRRVPLLVAQRADDPSLVVSAAGTEKIGSVDAKVLDVSLDGALVRWYLDPSTYRILRSTHSSAGPQGEAHIVSEYSDYRTVDGYPVAFHLEVSTNGEKDQVLALEECKFNPGVDAKIFEKPIFPTPPPEAPKQSVPTPAAGMPTPKKP